MSSQLASGTGRALTSHDSNETTLVKDASESGHSTFQKIETKLERKRSEAPHELTPPSSRRTRTDNESTKSLSNDDTVSGEQSPATTPKADNSATVNELLLDLPDWDKHPTAWGYLQALVPKYKSGYLDRQSSTSSERTGYLIGRKANCDFVQISKQHCVIYIETGNDGRNKGICIYLEDLSSNGTYVNGKMVGLYRIMMPPRFEVGTFHEDYRIGDLLGRGHFANVLRAVNKSTGRVTAVKVINKSKFSSRPKMLPSIIQEIGILMSLEAHPCVIQIEGVYNEPKYIYLVLEYVRGGELFDYVVKRRSLTETETRFVFFQLFTAIQYLHNRGVVHRDLKPENVLLVSKDTLHIKVTDFGLAKIKSNSSKLQSQCGTPNYVAPEVLDPTHFRAYGKECDLWSLGVMLYICLCGFPPFNGNTEYAPPSMKDQIRIGRFDFPSPYWDDISDDAKDLIKNLLTVNPLKRITPEKALEHPWMRQEARRAFVFRECPANISFQFEQLHRMCDAVSPDFLGQLIKSGQPDDLLATQPVNSMTQFTEHSFETW
ncbi:kinase-like domain-containing protein [Dichotomocladium elegans]|nr:kinase-like domain-containing protein [Dichotomocladium elegans]